MAGPLTRATTALLLDHMSRLGPDASMGDLEGILRLMAKWRSQALAQTLMSRGGHAVQGGLFAGMDYSVRAAEGSHAARLLGVYEAALQPHFERLAAAADIVIDIGCAEGYYAVGLARRFPHLLVHARDIDPIARERCHELAKLNNVTDRVIVGEEFGPTDFEAFAGRRVLVIVDAEGAEVDILHPELSPALAGMSLIVETHDGARPGALAEITRRFAATHGITRVDQAHKVDDLPAWLMELSELDQLLATWEWRHRLTPWLVMEPR